MKNRSKTQQELVDALRNVVANAILKKASGQPVFTSQKIVGQIEITVDHFSGKIREEVENKILDILNEFGDEPKQALSCICEYIDLAQHYRKYPNAPDPETQNL